MELPKYTELRESARPKLERLLPLSFPISMYLETTNRCMFRCTYCPMSLDGYEQECGGFRTMSLTEFQKIADDIKAGGILKVLRFYFMGEPLLNRELPAMITTACRMKLAERTELTTNGVLLNEATSKALINSGLDYLRISISSVLQSRHEQITQTPIKVEDIYNNIRRFRQLRDEANAVKPFLYVKLLDPGNPAEKDRFLDMYRDLADEAVVEETMNWNSYGDHDLSLGASAATPQPAAKEVCPFPFYTLAITANGDTTVCCVDWNKATTVGNVFEEDITTIWNGEKMRLFRQMHLTRNRRDNPSCKNCTFLYTTPDNIDNMPEDTVAALIRSHSG